MHPKFLTNLYRIQNDRKSASLVYFNMPEILETMPCSLTKKIHSTT